MHSVFKKAGVKTRAEADALFKISKVILQERITEKQAFEAYQLGLQKAAADAGLTTAEEVEGFMRVAQEFAEKQAAMMGIQAPGTNPGTPGTMGVPKMQGAQAQAKALKPIAPPKPAVAPGVKRAAAAIPGAAIGALSADKGARGKGALGGAVGGPLGALLGSLSGATLTALVSKLADRKASAGTLAKRMAVGGAAGGAAGLGLGAVAGGRLLGKKQALAKIAAALALPAAAGTAAAGGIGAIAADKGHRGKGALGGALGAPVGGLAGGAAGAVLGLLLAKMLKVRPPALLGGLRDALFAGTGAATGAMAGAGMGAVAGGKMLGKAPAKPTLGQKVKATGAAAVKSTKDTAGALKDVLKKKLKRLGIG